MDLAGLAAIAVCLVIIVVIGLWMRENSPGCLALVVIAAFIAGIIGLFVLL